MNSNLNEEIIRISIPRTTIKSARNIIANNLNTYGRLRGFKNHVLQLIIRKNIFLITHIEYRDRKMEKDNIKNKMLIDDQSQLMTKL